MNCHFLFACIITGCICFTGNLLLQAQTTTEIQTETPGNLSESLWHKNMGNWQHQVSSIPGSDGHIFAQFLKQVEPELNHERASFFTGFLHGYFSRDSAITYLNLLKSHYQELYRNYLDSILLNPNLAAPAGNSSGMGGIESSLGGCNPSCSNIGFQNGTLSSWSAYWAVDASSIAAINNADITGGACASVTQAAFDGNTNTYQVSLNTMGGVDPIAGPLIPVNPPLGGLSTLVGDGPVPGYGVGILDQSFNVSASNPILTLQYAVVLENPNHSGYQQPWFKIELLDGSGNDIPGCGQYFILSSSGIAGFTPVYNPSGGDTVYCRPWTTAFIPLYNYVGQCISVKFTASDCALGGHFGYAYVAASCNQISLASSSTVFCTGQKSATISGPPGAETYLWSTTNGCISGSKSKQLLTVTCAGTYSLITNSTAGPTCADTFSFTLPASASGPPPVPCFLIADTVCTGAAATVDATCSSPNSGNKFYWDFLGDGQYQDSSGTTAAWTYITPGTYDVKLHEVATSGCSADTVIPVVVESSAANGGLPVITSSAVNTTGCGVCNGQVTIILSQYSSGGLTLTNSLGDGIVQLTSPGNVQTSGGNVSVSTSATFNGGALSYTTTISYPFLCPGTIYFYITPTTAIPATRCAPSGFTGDTVVANIGVDGVNIVISKNIIPATCGGHNGSAKITVSGGAAPYTLKWSNALGTTDSISNLAAGTYTVTVTDNNGCSTTASATINLLAHLSVSVTPYYVNCYGNNDGSIKITPTSGSSPYTYKWLPNVSSTDSANGLAPGTYNITVTDNSGCSGVATTNILQPTKITDVITGNYTGLPCNTTGTAMANPSGGYGPYTFSWSTGFAYATDTGLAAGLYKVTITDANQCSLVDSVAVTSSGGGSTASVSIASTATTVCSGTSVLFTATPVNAGANASYQWQVNGNNEGSNSNTFTTASLANGDVVTCILTSNSSCGVTAVSSNSITITVNSNLVPSINITASHSTICSGESVVFTAATVNGGSAPAYQWKINGVNSGNGNTFTTTNLSNGDVITCVLTSNASCASPDTALSNNLTETVSSNLLPSINITANQSTICSGESVVFTAAIVNGGANPTYQWKVNGLNSGNGNTFTTSNLNNGDVITCVLTSNASCASPDTAVSNKLTETVSTTLAPSIHITASQSTICSGESVVFTAATVNGGSAPAYQWKINGVNSGNGNTFTTSNLNNGDVITCVLTSNASCASPDTALSNNLIETVSSNLIPSINITASQGTICSGESVVFTAAIVNGGANPTYQWKVNGLNSGNGNTFTTSNLNNGDVITCVLTSNASCASPDTAVSNKLTETVSTTLAPSIHITASQSTICSGESVVFTAATVNGGSAPAYQWKVNGVNSGSGNTFTTSNLSNGDVITCVLTSNASCASPDTALSNNLTETVSSNLIPSINITASQSTICSGESVVFTAVTANGGTNPAYQWKINGVNSGNGNTFTTSNLSNGDVITCVLTSNASCASPDTAVSNKLTETVSSNLIPSINITASQSTICSGESVVFTAVTANGGTNPAYQWKINGVNSGNGNTFTTSNLSNGDVITCVLTSNASCASPDTAVSNKLTETVSSNLIPSINITASQGTICSGESVVFSAVTANGGTNPAYQWKINGVNSGNSNTFTTSNLNNGDVITCVLTSNASCASPDTALSNNLIETVSTTLAPSINITASQSTICSGESVVFTAVTANGGTNPAYQWKINGVNSGNGNTFTTSNLSNGDVITCVLTSNASCASPDTALSNNLIETVSTTLAPSINITASQGTICSGESVVFTAVTANGGTNPAYQWKINGVNSGNGNTFTTSNLSNGDVITCVLTSNASCASPDTALSNNLIETVSTTLAPSINITASQSTICSGESVVFTAVTANGGTNPAYQWKINGVNSGNGNTFTTSNLSNGDVITCVLTSNASCASPDTALSNNLIETVSTTLAPSINITASQGTICSGESVVFTAVTANGGTNPAYQWKINGVNSGNGNTFTTSNLNNGDVITCLLTSNASCASPDTAVSNNLIETVSTTLAPSINITASQGTICSGESVVFTAAIVNGGANPAYQWKINGVNSGSGNTFTTSNLSNGDVITCVLTSNASCASPDTALSNNLTETVSSNLIPSINITASQGTICSGESVVFTAVAVNGGSAPAYQWKINGVNSGNGNTFTTSNLSNGDVITCVLTSNASCASPDTALSNNLIETVSTTLAPSINITASQSTICSGENVAFTAVAVNGGSAPAYQWKVNGLNSGNSNTFTTANLSNGDVITCVLTSNASCASPDTALSNNLIETVSTTLAPSINITASQSTICSGENVAFTAVAVNGGSAPAYQWKVNGLNSGNSNTFTTANLSNGDVITCVLTSNASCASPDTALSNNLTETVIYVPPVTIYANKLTICPGDSSDICAPSGFITYKWNTGDTGICLDVNSPGNYFVTVTNSTGCQAGSNLLTISVFQSPPVSTSQSNDTFTAYNAFAYQWYFNGLPIANDTSATCIAKLAGSYIVQITDSNGCTAFSTPQVFTDIVSIQGDGFEIYPNPLGSGKWQLNVGQAFMGAPLQIYDDNGRLVYTAIISSLHVEIELNVAPGVYLAAIASPYCSLIKKLVRL